MLNFQVPRTGRAAFHRGEDADCDVFAETDVILCPLTTEPRTWRFHGSAAMPLTVSRPNPSPHPLTLAREDGSVIVVLPGGEQSWAQLTARAGRWELSSGGSLKPDGGPVRELKAPSGEQ